MMIEPLVSSEWLSDNINNPDLVILEVTSGANKAGTKPEPSEQKIIHTRNFDLKNNFSDSASSFPNTFPSVDQFQQGCRALGINKSSTIVVYDSMGIYLSPRAWWMFKTMGHDKVYVLDGGLPDWVKKGFETADSYSDASSEGDFEAVLKSDDVKMIDFISSNISDQTHLVVDARSNDRFLSKVPEPREGLRSGNIPESINIPYTELLDEGKYKPKAELLSVFQKAEVNKRPIVFSCGSGITACIVLLAAEMVLDNETAVYDGSWTEYGTLVDASA